MSSAWEMNIDVPRSGSAQFTILARDVVGGPVDLTGVDIALEVRRQSGDSATILTAGIETNDSETGIVVTDAGGGQILVTIYGADLASIDGEYETVRLSHKIRFTKSGDAPLLVFGQINLLPE
jgi:hypothetical protein